MVKRIRLMDVEAPRLISEMETAHHLGMSISEFSRRSPEFERNLGMPKKHAVLAKRDRIAIDQWLNRQFSVGADPIKVSDLVKSRMKALQNGQSAH